MHGGDDIQHIGGFADLFSFQQVEILSSLIGIMLCGAITDLKNRHSMLLKRSRTISRPGISDRRFSNGLLIPCSRWWQGQNSFLLLAKMPFNTKWRRMVRAIRQPAEF